MARYARVTPLPEIGVFLWKSRQLSRHLREAKSDDLQRISDQPIATRRGLRRALDHFLRPRAVPAYL